MSQTCEDCTAEGTTCEQWCDRNDHELHGHVHDRCHCGAYGWVKGEVSR